MTYSASKNILEWHFRSNVVKSAASSSRSSSHFKILCQPNKAVSYKSARDMSTTVGFFLISVSKILTTNMTYQCIVCDPFLPAGFNLIVSNTYCHACISCSLQPFETDVTNCLTFLARRSAHLISHAITHLSENLEITQLGYCCIIIQTAI